VRNLPHAIHPVGRAEPRDDSIRFGHTNDHALNVAHADREVGAPRLEPVSGVPPECLCLAC
jgi:hypothetical protein